MAKQGKIVVVSQYDDSALYINGRLVNGGDCKLVNGAVDALKKLRLHIVFKTIHYDIWNTKGGWPKKLSSVDNMI